MVVALTQLGTLAAQRFADRVDALDLTPPQVGLLRAVHLTGAGRSVMNRVGAAAKAHEAELTAGLSAAERKAAARHARRSGHRPWPVRGGSPR